MGGHNSQGESVKEVIGGVILGEFVGAVSQVLAGAFADPHARGHFHERDESWMHLTGMQDILAVDHAGSSVRLGR